MASNPTQLTPPRVAVLDPRTGAISREWYRFFLSLLNATQTSEEASTLLPEAGGGISSTDAVVNAAIQALQSSLPSPVDLSVLQNEVQALALMPPPQQLEDPRYGVFYDTTTQTAAAINTAYPITLNTTDFQLGVTIGSPTSRVYVDHAGIYNFQFSAQLNKASAAKADVNIWYRKNGVDVANSATKVSLQGSSAAAVAAWNFVVQMAANDYFELVWSTTDTGCQIVASAASSPVPAIPSVILTVTDNISTMGV